jgi:hypothetical protein
VGGDHELPAQILDLADVSRPVVLRETSPGTLRHPWMRLSELRRGALQEVIEYA